MKTTLTLIFTVVCCMATATSWGQQDQNPYAVFGSEPYIAGAEKADEAVKVLVIENIAEGSTVARLEHNTQTGIVTSFDIQGNIVGIRQLREGERAWPNVDPLADKYYSFSPYSYTLNNPVNAIDPDGRLTIFVNGMDPWPAISNSVANMPITYRGITFRQANQYPYNPDRSFQIGGNDPYGWGGLDDFYTTQYEDNNVAYVNGSYNAGTNASTRYDAGVAKANELIEMINSGKIVLSQGEMIRLVGYSQGAAYAAGMASVLVNSRYAGIFDFVHYIAPHQPEGFNHPEGVLGRQFGSSRDHLSGTGTKINNINDVNHHIGDFGRLYNGSGHLLGNGFNLNNFVMDVIRAGGTVTVR